MTVSRWLAVACAVLAACGDEGGGTADGGTGDGGAADTGAGLVATPPAPPVLTPCPEGWRRITADGVAVCEPWPEGGVSDCDPGQAHFPGEPGCAPVSGACPTGDFADDLPAGGPIVFVRPGASGDGTRESPFGTIAEALSSASAGTTVALARGRYDEPVTLYRGISLHGACAEETVLTAPAAGGTAAVVDVVGPEVGIRGLRIEDADRLGIAVGPMGEAGLEGVAVENVRGVAINVAGGGRLTGEGVLVRGTRAFPDGTFGRGMTVEYGSSVELRRVALEHNREAAVACSLDGPSVTLEDVVIRDTAEQASDDAFGRGVVAAFGCEVTLRRAVVERNLDVAILAIEDAALTLEDTVVRETDGRRFDGDYGRGVDVDVGATARLARVRLDRNREAGLVAFDRAAVTLDDAVIRDTLPGGGTMVFGHAIDVLAGSTLTARRVLAWRNVEVSLLVHGPGSTLDAEDISVHDTRSEANHRDFGRGLIVQSGASATVTRMHVERSRGVGLYVHDEGSSFEGTDVVVRNTLEHDCASDTCPELVAGTGVGTYRGGRTVLTRFAIEDAVLCGVQLADGASVDLHQGEVAGCEIGACIQVEGYDLDRLSDRVRYRDNGAALQATELPVPAPATPSL